MRFDAWLLALAEPASATAQLLGDVDADVVSSSDAGAIAEAIERRFRQHARGEGAVAVATHARLGRRARAGELFDAIERLTGLPSAEPTAVAATAESSATDVRRAVRHAAPRATANGRSGRAR